MLFSTVIYIHQHYVVAAKWISELECGSVHFVSRETQ
mgnify:CR=1 FL=1